MFYLKVILTTLWSLLCCSIWIVISLFRWRSPTLFSPSVRTLSWGGLKILGYRTKLEGLEYSQILPAVMVSNHQSFLDTLLLGSVWPKGVVPIGKKEIGWIPIVGWWFVLCGAKLINRKSAKEARSTLDQQLEVIRRGFGIGITPEGTRNLSGKGLLPFKKGAFHLAIQAQVPIIAWVIAPLGNIANWQKKKLRKAVIPIAVLPPIPTQGLTEADVDSLISKVREAMLKKLEELEEKVVFV